MMAAVREVFSCFNYIKWVKACGFLLFPCLNP
jgi:hypothetical protein